MISPPPCLHTHVCRCTQNHPSVWSADTRVHKGTAVGYTCAASKCASVLLETFPSRWNPTLTRAGSCSCLFLRPESLTSPSVSLCVRELHANDRALSTGEPEEEQSVLCWYHTLHLTFILFFTSRLRQLSIHPSVLEGWRQMSCVAVCVI